ncbi:MAG: mRNA surveillance protein pelota [Candidatus Njordarchaeota archaeon]
MHILDIDEKNGIIELQVENVDDLFVLWNFIRKGDLLEAMTSRKVKFESGESERIKMRLVISVEKISFHDTLETLRVSGRIVEGPEKFVSLGTYHTIQIKRGMKIKIIREGGLTQADLEILKESDLLSKINPVIIIAVERDEATVGLLLGTGLKIIQTIYQTVSYKDSTNAKTLKHMFFKQITDVIREILNQYRNIDGIIVGGPGLTKNELSDYIKNTIEGSEKIRIILDQASSGTVAGIYELMRRGVALKISKDIQIAKDMQYYEEFLMHLGKNDGLIAYGLDDVYTATMWGATKVIMVNIDLVNTIDESIRNRVIEIIKTSQPQKCYIRIISRTHPLFEKIKNFGGIIALLKFKIHH